jgi:hypothetical protein
MKFYSKKEATDARKRRTFDGVFSVCGEEGKENSVLLTAICLPVFDL